MNNADYKRGALISDICGAMSNGFKAESDLAPHHLPLLSDEALERVFNESEKWRDKTRERELEELVERMRSDNERIGGYYVDLRGIIGAMDVPYYFNPKPGKPRHIQWSEQIARGLVNTAEVSDRNRMSAIDAEQRVDFLGRYVKACDDKRIPYNWNVFKMPIGPLRDTVYSHEGQARLTNCDTNPDRVNHFAERKAQETEQSLRWHSQRADETRRMVQMMASTGQIPTENGQELLDVLLGNVWTVWEWGYTPKDITRDTLLEVKLTNGDRVTLDSSVIEWSEVKAYRLAK